MSFSPLSLSLSPACALAADGSGAEVAWESKPTGGRRHRYNELRQSADLEEKARKGA
jgi:hypothetical protein